ncbi:hypothetical protein [Anaerococcus hydrogenalis]|uniref:Uncharacterized protein n=1 Tax=Anaerococcus hydrogenalis TaxID=33029 RepID=A0A2N6UIA5_9FIRM|nr:hypothetical protein [Anaerococcus hydrogenalis]MDK7694732.1 hypothetical protein [Anaerococcus hydrogenalis]MDK7696714.1 hypothetical protein [Anaerococcus hydrogenalis]MDK7707759.1 hypothetical protein [Anaerococcus hydrogenalis]PMC81370.1 hypothetical protein CJ192_04920 [Anaerococcus hydrogenalis]
MKSDKEKLFDMFNVFENAIKEVEDIGEYRDYDLDQNIEEIYNKLEDLSIDVWGLIRERGWSDD